MGMFDSVWAPCPKAECTGEAEFQSKDGECQLRNYGIYSVPAAIARDVIGTGERSGCNKCGHVFALRLAGPEARLEVVPYDGYSDSTDASRPRPIDVEDA